MNREMWYWRTTVHLDKFRAWAEAGKVAGSQIWMQLNHQGKQIPAFMNKDVVGPSALPMSDELKGLFDISQRTFP